MRLLRKDQKGFTLVELLIVVPIMAIVSVAAIAVIIHVVQSTYTTAHMVVIRQVQTAGDLVSHDGIQAQVIEVPAEPESRGFPFIFRWTDWDDSEAHEVIYSLSGGDIEQLQRQEIIRDKDGTQISDITILVAEFIDSANTSCSPIDEGVLTFTVAAEFEGRTETRTYEVTPRALA